MTTRYPQAVVWSATTHALVVAAILYATYIAQKNLKDPPRFIELVAGPGDNFEATVAPALGNPTLTAPTVAPPVATIPPPPVVEPTPVPTPAQPAPIPPPVQTAPVQTAVPRATPAPPVQKSTPPAQKAAPPSQRITKEQFEKENAGKKSPPAPKAQTIKAPKVDAAGIAKGVLGGSTANKTGGAGGKALTREEASQMDLYFSLFRTMLRESIAKQPGLSNTLTARLSLVISADGVLNNPRIVKPSGNAEFDRAVIAAVKSIGKMKARPDKTTETVEVDINLRDLSAP